MLYSGNLNIVHNVFLEKKVENNIESRNAIFISILRNIEKKTPVWKDPKRP